MKPIGDFPGKSILKRMRWNLRRSISGFKYGFDNLINAPIIFGNAMPKSGSHLLTQILQGLTVMGPFVDPGYPPVNRSEKNHPVDPRKVLRNLQEMRPGDIGYGYIHAVEPYLALLTQPDRATIFIYRDPRDMIISHIFYATDLNKNHGMHNYYTEKLSSMAERIDAAIRGVEEIGHELASVSQRYQSYTGWLSQPEVHCVKFEDLILNQESALVALLDYLMERGARFSIEMGDAINVIREHIDPKKSGTFRKGVPGGWRDHFTAENKDLFKQETGDLLQKLGYEDHDQW